jgi:His-Xaa-Ser system protein HxsD
MAPSALPARSSRVVDESIYSLDALLRTCYSFTDRVYIFIAREEDSRFRVHFTERPSGMPLEVVVGEFENALIDHELRLRVERETRSLRELLLAEAFAPCEE